MNNSQKVVDENQVMILSNALKIIFKKYRNVVPRMTEHVEERLKTDGTGRGVQIEANTFTATINEFLVVHGEVFEQHVQACRPFKGTIKDHKRRMVIAFDLQKFDRSRLIFKIVTVSRQNPDRWHSDKPWLENSWYHIR